MVEVVEEVTANEAVKANEVVTEEAEVAAAPMVQGGVAASPVDPAAIRAARSRPAQREARRREVNPSVRPIDKATAEI